MRSEMRQWLPADENTHRALEHGNVYSTLERQVRKLPLKKRQH